MQWCPREAIRITSAGYPTGRTFSEFLNRFGILAPEVLELNCDEKIACTRILEKIGLLGFSDKENKGFPKNWSDG